MPHQTHDHAARIDAQRRWAMRSLRERLVPVRRTRHLLVRDQDEMLAALAPRQPAEALISEVLPLVDACRFLERRAAGLLAPRRHGLLGRPLWLIGHRAEVARAPWGIVLIIAPGNYPLFLAGVQLLQALTAGNAVLIKPAPGWSAPMTLLARLLEEAGLPQGLLTVLGEEPSEAEAAIEAGIDLLVLTGSAATGRRVEAALAPHLVPSIMELSGCDAVVVLQGADIACVADAVSFGLRLNNSATCIAPRRIFVMPEQHDALIEALGQRLRGLPAAELPVRVAADLLPLLRDARERGAAFVPDDPGEVPTRLSPLLVTGAAPHWPLLKADLFAPVSSLCRVSDTEQAFEAVLACPYRLGVSIFGEAEEARALARRLPVGSVTINDLIAPTADARLPFGGRGESGFGVTRGAEGLLAMTTPKTVTVRSGRLRPHYEKAGELHREAASHYLRLVHGRGGLKRLNALSPLISSLKALARSRGSAS